MSVQIAKHSTHRHANLFSSTQHAHIVVSHLVLVLLMWELQTNSFWNVRWILKMMLLIPKNSSQGSLRRQIVPKRMPLAFHSNSYNLIFVSWHVSGNLPPCIFNSENVGVKCTKLRWSAGLCTSASHSWSAESPGFE